jgi:hypothetical protein
LCEWLSSFMRKYTKGKTLQKYFRTVPSILLNVHFLKVVFVVISYNHSPLSFPHWQKFVKLVKRFYTQGRSQKFRIEGTKWCYEEPYWHESLILSQIQGSSKLYTCKCEIMRGAVARGPCQSPCLLERYTLFQYWYSV